MKIELVAHNPYWKLEFEKEAARIRANFVKTGIKATVSHIGSTAIPGLMAKPTIDILVGLEAQEALDTCIAAFKKGNYIYVSKYNSIMPFRRFFIKIKASNPKIKWQKDEIGLEDDMPLRQHYKRNFHVHVVHKETVFFARHMAFVQHLKRDAVDRQVYQDLKVHLSQLDWETGNDYAQAKSGLITEIMQKLGFEY